MNAIELTLLNFRKNLFSVILIILETSVLFLSVNFLAGTLRERKMLIEPFEFLFDENTFYVNDDYAMENLAFNGLSAAQSRELLLEDISGDYEIFDVMTASVGGYTVISLSDEIYERLSLPLENGNFKDGAGSFGTARGEHRIAFEDGAVLTLKTSGTLTETTFIPDMVKGGSGMRASDFYSVSVRDSNVIIVNRAAIKGYEDRFRASGSFFIRFNGSAAENIAALREKTFTDPCAEIGRRSRAELYEDMKDFVPIIAVIGFIVTLGIIFISVIIFKENERRNAVFLLCGYSRAGVVRLHCAGIFALTAASAGVSALIFAVMKAFGLSAAVGVRLTRDNLFASLAAFAALMLAAAAAPVIMTARRTPAEYFRTTN